MQMGQANLDVFAQTLLELARQDRNVLAVTSDSRGSGRPVSYTHLTLPTKRIV